MAFTFTSYGDISPRTNLYAHEQFLAYAQPKLILERYAKSLPMPKNKTLTVKFRRCVPYDVSTVPLQEGVTPTPQAAQYEDVSTSLKQFGAWVGLTDVIADTHEDPVLKQQTKLCAEQAAKTRELYNWGQFRAGTSVYFGSTTASPTLRTQVNAPLSLALLRKVETALDAQYAERVTERIRPNGDYGTEHILPAYIGIVHTNQKPDLYDIPKFKAMEDYSSASFEPGEVGAVEGTRFVASAFLGPIIDAGSATLNGMRSTGGSNVDVYTTLIFGEEALGVVPLKEATDVMLTVMNPNKPSPSDPLGQRGFVSWKIWHAALILNQNWVSRVEVGATA